MPISVVISRDDSGAPSTREVYDAGDKYALESGELTIISTASGRPQLLALYGSGNWLSVHVDDFVRVITEKPAEDEDEDDFGSDDEDNSPADSEDDSDTASDEETSSELDALLAEA